MYMWFMVSFNTYIFSAGSVYGGANGPEQSAVAGEGGNTVSAHRIACENIKVAPLLGGFRGGADLRGRRSDHQRRSRFD